MGLAQPDFLIGPIIGSRQARTEKLGDCWVSE